MRQTSGIRLEVRLEIQVSSYLVIYFLADHVSEITERFNFQFFYGMKMQR